MGGGKDCRILCPVVWDPQVPDNSNFNMPDGHSTSMAVLYFPLMTSHARLITV